MARVIIVGGSISGLALAHRLQQMAPGLDVLLLEQRDRPGGTLWTERRDGFQVEIGPNGFLDTKPTTVALCRDLHLGDQLVPASESAGRNRYLFLAGELQKLPHSLASFLGTRLLSGRGKLSLLLERWRARRRSPDDETIAAFARRRGGRDAVMLADALVTGIYAGDAERLSVAACFPRLVAFEQQYGSVMKGMAAAARLRRAEAAARGEPYQRSGRMWSFRPGLRLLAETLHERLRSGPLFGVSVRRIEKGDPAANGLPPWVVRGEGQDRWTADVVVLTCPAFTQAALLADLDVELAAHIDGIPYNCVVVVALGYRVADVPRPLDGFGFLVPQRSGCDLLGVQWCSSIFPDRAPPGKVLLRAMCGGVRRPEVVDWEDDRLIEAVRAELRASMGITAAPVFQHLVRWPRAIPQYVLGHLERVAWIEARTQRHPGLFLGGNAYHGVALNDCTEQAVLLAERIAGYLRSADLPRS
jgi:oxygen-dependent protoporphyrinogen oxidase